MKHEPFYKNHQFIFVGVETLYRTDTPDHLYIPGPSWQTPERFLTLTGSDNNPYPPGGGECWHTGTPEFTENAYPAGELYEGGVAAGYLCYEIPANVTGPWKLTTHTNSSVDRIPNVHFELPDSETFTREPVTPPSVIPTRDPNTPAGSITNPHPFRQTGTHQVGHPDETEPNNNEPYNYRFDITVQHIKTEPDPTTNRTIVHATLNITNTGPLPEELNRLSYDTVGPSGQVRPYQQLLHTEICGNTPQGHLLTDIVDTNETVTVHLCWSVLPTDTQNLLLRVSFLQEHDRNPSFWELPASQTGTIV